MVNVAPMTMRNVAPMNGAMVNVAPMKKDTFGIRKELEGQTRKIG